jgi:GT2 family glycosyltransferase
MNADREIGLQCARDVERDDKFYFALTEAPWLRIDFRGPLPAGRWIELRYAASFFDPLARPVLRCFLKNSFHDEILPGALFGRAIWVGFVPSHTEEIWISPTNRTGPFSFSIERCSVLSNSKVIQRALRQNLSHCLKGLGAKLIGLQHFAKAELKKALSAKSFATYHEWRKMRVRDLDVVHFDLPRTDWKKAPHIRFVTFQDGGGEKHLARLISELETQSYSNWSLIIVASFTGFELPQRQDGASNGKFSKLLPDAEGLQLLDGLSENDVVAPIAICDSIPSYAIPVFVEAANADLKTEIFYGDEDFINEKDEYCSPLLRPDWSSVTGTALGSAIFFRVRFLAKHRPNLIEFLRRADELTIDKAALKTAVAHIRRVLRTRRGDPSGRASAPKPLAIEYAQISKGSDTGPRATLIIPTKDRFDLLYRCIESLEKSTSLEEIEVIIVDNGTVQREARRLLDRLAHQDHFRVIQRLGTFNFAGFCNDAAGEALGSTLVFLNNDIEIISKQWLEPLLYWARQPEVGAVGAKLIYPNGRVQHAGVVVGIGGRAGHFERLLLRDDIGYLGRLSTPHEVSSVTGACLAVDKQKFNAVNGFDAVNFPVELNDIDLCLRLSERGWKSILLPDVVLIHRESASRGLVPHPDKTYGKEHHCFRTRWMHKLRDDPFFHPALSLYAEHPALD